MAGVLKRRPPFHRISASKIAELEPGRGPTIRSQSPWLLSFMEVLTHDDHAACASRIESPHRRLPRRKIGLERQWRQRLAGLRTNTLVALGAAIFVTYSHVAPDGVGDTRIAAPGRLGDRLSGRWRNLQGGSQRAGPQHRRDPVVLGGGRPARRRRACTLRPP